MANHNEPNETTEMWRDHRRHLQQSKAAKRDRVTGNLFASLDLETFRIVRLTEYHFAIYKGDQRLDYYPTNMKYHKVWNGKRGHASVKRIPELFNK